MKNPIDSLLERLKAELSSLHRGDKKLPKDGMLILLLSGILIYVILMPTSSTGHLQSGKRTDTVQESTAVQTGTAQTSDSYQKRLERELEEFLSEVEGVGEVKVLIYLDTSQEYVVEKDSPTTISSQQEREAEDTTMSRLEENRQEETVYTVNEYGEQVPFITQTRNPNIQGIVIAAQGAGQDLVRVRLMQLAMALYGVEANKVEVFVLKQD